MTPPTPEQELRASKLKGLAALVIALTGLVTAVGAFLHRQPEEAAHAGYLELTTAILDVQATEKRNHDDLVALQAFVADYAKGHQSVIAPAPPLQAPEEAPSPSPAPSVLPKLTGAPRAVVSAASPPGAPPPPAVEPLRAPKTLRSADSIAW